VTIAGLDDERFKELVREALTPAKAISDPANLHGRTAKLRQIEKAFNATGRHISIFGDRGVGKTSLALSAAVMHQSSDNNPIIVACDQQASFSQLVLDIGRACLPPNEVIQKKTRSEGLKINLPFAAYNNQITLENGEIPKIKSINDAVQILKWVCCFHSKSPVVIVDEFDQLSNNVDKKFFADLVKQLSDQEIGLRIIFCGIGSSHEELIGIHMSTGRYLLPVELDRLTHDARWGIIDAAARKLNVTVPEETNIRIGHLSDGFPYYVHLMGESMFWAMFEDNLEHTVCNIDHFDKGVKEALQSAETALKIAYDKATQKYSDDYQEVLWAVADSKILRRQISEIYENSYLSIMDQRPERPELSKHRFNTRLYNLARESHGRILGRTGAGWYQFRENVLRGYVRLKAEEQGIRVGIDHHLT